MHTEYAALQQFLSSNAKNPELIPKAMERIRPFFKIVESGDYPLSPADKLDREEVAHAISQAIGKPVEKVVFVSHTRPFPKPEWMSQDVYLHSIRDIFEQSLWDDSLGASLWDSLGDSLEDSLGASLWVSLGDSLEDSLGASLWDSLKDSLSLVSLRISLRVSLRASLRVSLFYFLGFAIVGDTERVERLTPLVTMLPKAIPLGEKKNESGTWLVLVA